MHMYYNTNLYRPFNNDHSNFFLLSEFVPNAQARDNDVEGTTPGTRCKRNSKGNPSVSV